MFLSYGHGLKCQEKMPARLLFGPQGATANLRLGWRKTRAQLCALVDYFAVWKHG